MEPETAERAAACCDQAIREIDELLYDTRQLTRRRKFGDTSVR